MQTEYLNAWFKQFDFILDINPQFWAGFNLTPATHHILHAALISLYGGEARAEAAKKFIFMLILINFMGTHAAKGMTNFMIGINWKLRRQIRIQIVAQKLINQNLVEPDIMYD